MDLEKKRGRGRRPTLELGEVREKKKEGAGFFGEKSLSVLDLER